MTTTFSGGGSRREPPTMGKQLVNFITCGCESSAPFFVIYKARLFCNSYTSSSHVRLYFFCFRTEVEMLGIEDLAVSKYSTKKAFDKSSSFINQFEWVFLTVWHTIINTCVQILRKKDIGLVFYLGLKRGMVFFF
jgi:hypothetical protein